MRRFHLSTIFNRGRDAVRGRWGRHGAGGRQFATRASVPAGLALLATGFLLLGSAAHGQQRGTQNVSLQAPTDTVNPAQRFAPGVLTTIEPELDRADAILVHDMVELRSQPELAWEPYSSPVSRTLYEMAKNAPFTQDVWCLEFTFKPLRMIEVDVPQQSGRMQRRLIWYLVYRVRNVGAGLAAEVQPDGSFVTTEKGVEPLRFIPQFVLRSRDRDAQGEPIAKEYLDRLVPAAMAPIARREFSGQPLLNSVEMAAQELPVESQRSAAGHWGVAVWEGVDPEIDFFSVEVRGLTNAYRWEDPEGSFQAGNPPGTGRQFERKVLQLNFWRPGDAYGENEREIRFGTAPDKADYYGVNEGVASRWTYR